MGLSITGSTGIMGSSIGDMAGGPVDIALNDLSDVVVTPLVSTGQYLRYNGITSTWGNSSLDADIFAYIDGSLIANDGIYITEVPGPNTFTIGLGDITPLSVTTDTVTANVVNATTISGALTGNAETASALETPRSISITGDATWSTTFDGSADVTSGLTLATVNSSVGQYAVVTVNNKGLVTSATNLSITGDASGISSGNGLALTLATVNASPQPNTFRKITVNEKGLVTATSPVLDSDIVVSLGYTPVNIAGDTMAGDLILNANPTQALGAATKQYVDNVAQGIVAKPAALAATTENLTSIYNNGTSGVGATLTSTTNGIWPGVDGVTTGWAIFSGVLVKNQTNLAENGRYYISDLGSASTPWVLTRCTYCDTAAEIPGAYVFVQDGTQEATGWIQVVSDPSTFVVGTDPIYVYQFSGSGAIVSGTGIEVIGNAVSLATGNTLSLFNLSVNGLVARTATNTVTARTLAVSGTGLSISNADGTAGNPTISSNATSTDTASTLVARDSFGNFSAGIITADLTGNASTATALETSRTINGVAFDGTADIVISSSTFATITFDDSGIGAVSSTTFDGSVARTISYNTVGASPLIGSSSLTTTGTVTSGTWSGLFGTVSGANLTNLTAGNLTGTIPSVVLGNSTLYVGTTAVPLNRPSANQSLTGISSITLPGATSGTIQLLPTAVAGTTVLTLPSTTGTLALTSQLPIVNDGILTLNVSGTGLSGSATFTANQSGNSTFTVTSNATSANTASTIVARDASGNFSAGTITATLSGNASTATTATTLATGRTIGMTGDVTWTSASFDGSANVSGTSTLATVTQGAGSSFVKITLDTKGRVTGNTAVAAADITSLVDGTYVNVAGDTMSGKLTINKSTAVTVGTVGSSDQCEMINNGSGGVVMTFHRSGAYAINMGLDTDNVFRLGGYSNGTNVYRIQSDTAGNFTAQGNVNAASDERLKTDWSDLPIDFVDQLAQVKHGSYTRIDTKERQVGVSAQSLRKLLPEAVAEDIDGILSVSYGNAAMVSVIKMAERLVGLESKLEMLVARIATLEGKI